MLQTLCQPGLPAKPLLLPGAERLPRAEDLQGHLLVEVQVPGPVMPVAESTPVNASQGALTLAAREHLGRTESLLTMVRADARSGRRSSTDF